MNTEDTRTTDVFTLTEMRIIHEGFKGQCNDMNEARLTTALGDALSMLTEVREVLHGLRGRYVKDCWCDAGDDAEHYATCLRARGLWAKLQIEGSNQIQEQEKSNA